MKKGGRRTFGRELLPPREILERIAFASMITAAVVLLVLSRAEVGGVDRIGERLRDAMVPILSVMAEPVGAVRRTVGRVGEQFALAEENRRLREQNARLRAWEAEAARLQVENAALRRALRMPPAENGELVATARVVADSGSPFVHTRLLDAGTEDGVLFGMAALSDQGLVGRVTDVGARSARLLLLTDLNSRIPVLVAPSNDPAILAGTNGPEPVLNFLPLNPQISVGDRVMTSGAGGVLPAGLFIGRVSRVEEDQARVVPAADWSRLDYVRLVRRRPPPDPSREGGTGAVSSRRLPDVRASLDGRAP